MRKENLPGVLVLVLVAIAMFQPWGLAANAWVRHTGAVVPDGEYTMRFAGRGVRTVAVLGERAVSPGLTMRSTAFAAVLRFPGDSVVEQGESSRAGTFARAIEHRWMVVRRVSAESSVSDEVGFAATYNALTNTVLIDGQVYPLRKGNVFDVRLAIGGGMKVRQLPISWTGDQPGGRVFQDLELGPPVQRHPCPPNRAATAPIDHAV